MSRRPRIGVDMHVFDGKFQGSRSHLLGLYAELPRLCPEYDFVFLLDGTQALASWPGFDAPNVSFVRMPPANPLVRLGWQLPRLRRQLQLDLVHTQYVIPLWPAAGNLVTIHDVLFEPHPEFFTPLFVLRSRWLMRWSARRADRVLTVSDYSKRELMTRYGVAAARLAVTHNAVDTAVFHPGDEGRELVVARGLQPGGYLLTVGRIEPRKNHAALLRAYRALPGQPPPLVIVGQRDFGFADFEAELAAMPPDRQVLILSDVDDRELPALYRHARIFVYPSFAEGFGMPPLEALASGVPVLSADTTAIPEVVGDAGLLADPHDAQAMATRLQELLDQPALAARLRERGLQRAATFTWRASAEVLAQAVRSCLPVVPAASLPTQHEVLR